MSVETRQRGARVAALQRHRSPGDPDILAARRDLATQQLTEHVERILAGAPPLTDAQLQRVAALLRAGRSGAST